jgi:phosphatidylinositol glycan class Z
MCAGAGDLLNIDVFRSWEFEADAPVRSMASLRLFNMPLWALAWMCKRSGTSPSAMAVFATQRLTFLALSFVSGQNIPPYVIHIRLISIADVSIAHLLPSHPRRELTLCSFASTSAALALSVRPFSNAVESAVLTATLAAFCAFVRRPGVSPATAMGALCAVGLFARFTFAIFALPLGVLFLSDIVRRRAIGSTCAAAASFAVVALAHIWSDTAYYGTSTLVLAPVNAALYNLKTENLAQHGVHPRWLHAVVNAPMVLGLGPYAAALFGAVQFKAGFGEGDIAARGKHLRMPIQNTSPSFAGSVCSRHRVCASRTLGAAAPGTTFPVTFGNTGFDFACAFPACA